MAGNQIALRDTPWVRRSLIGVALFFLGLFVVLPVVAVFTEAFVNAGIGRGRGEAQRTSVLLEVSGASKDDTAQPCDLGVPQADGRPGQEHAAEQLLPVSDVDHDERNHDHGGGSACGYEPSSTLLRPVEHGASVHSAI